MKHLPATTLGVATAIFLASGCSSTPQAVSNAESVSLVRISLAHEAPAPNTRPMEASASGERYFVENEDIIDDEDIESARVAMTATGLTVVMQFTEEGAARLQESTGGGNGKRIGFLLDSQLISAPVIRSTIGRSPVEIQIPMSEEEARFTAEAIGARFSALP